MRQSNVLVRPSSFEGMPLTVMEAMASGIPVVATPVGGTPELIEEGVHGYLFPVGDHRALADSVNKVLDNPEEAARMGLRGRGSVESRYTWDQVVEKTEQVYAQVASR
jgi:glycosyltransferase involved in cell wall biosynthesis